jgi:bifunctional DNase/RNase
MMDAFSLQLTEIIIYKIQEGIFYSKLICQSPTETIEVDSRTSDALAIAVRFDAPIYTYENILDSAGMQMDDKPNPKKAEDNKNKTKVTSNKNDLSSLSITELQKMLEEVLEQEDYIKAAQIRDEINSRK